MEGYKNYSQKLGNIIEKIAFVQNEEDCEEICKELEKLYMKDGSENENFRHEYSSISGKLRELSNKKEEGINYYDIQLIAFNMNVVYRYACTKNKLFIKSLFKLNDHINLEAGRMAYVQQIKDEVDDAKANIKQQIQNWELQTENIKSQISKAGIIQDNLNVEYDKLNKDMSKNVKLAQKTKQKIEDSQRESITILGIFAAIVLAFTGGIAYSTSVFENIHKSSIYRIIIISLIIGFVMINIISLLFYFIQTIHGRTKLKYIVVWVTDAIIVILIITTWIMIYCKTLDSEKMLNKYNAEQIEMK